jgi:signal transduction histidine kinase
VRRIADLIYTRRSVSGDMPVEHVAKLFDAESNLDALATLENDGSFGLVLRSRLTHDLGRRFGYALFARKPIHVFNEPSFLSCDAAEEPVKVISEATKRRESAIYDDIVVTEDGAYHGLVSMRLLMAHGKDLLARSMAEVCALELQNQKLDELNRAQREFVANVTHELRRARALPDLVLMDVNMPFLSGDNLIG